MPRRRWTSSAAWRSRSRSPGALGAAHKHDLVHRDVKPANVLLIHRSSPRAADHAYLSDFGIAKHASSVSGLTATGQLVGTLSYVSPEQIEDRPVDGRTDIYSLGCVLFECLTGRPAFKKEADVAVLMAHINEEAPAVTTWRTGCPTDLSEVVAKMLEKDPGRSLPDAATSCWRTSVRWEPRRLRRSPS